MPSLLRFLARLLGPRPAAPPDARPEPAHATATATATATAAVAATERAKAVEARAAQRQRLRDFMSLVSAHLPDAQRQALAKGVLREFDDGCDAAESFEYGVMGSQQLGHWLALQVDAQGIEDVEWQIEALAAIRGLAATWYWPGATHDSASVQDALGAASHWAEAQGYTLVHVGLDGEGHQALLVSQADAPAVQAAARAAGLSARRAPRAQSSH